MSGISILKQQQNEISDQFENNDENDVNMKENVFIKVNKPIPLLMTFNPNYSKFRQQSRKIKLIPELM